MPALAVSKTSINGPARSPIHITSQDKARLEDLLAEVKTKHARSWGDLEALDAELHRAVVLDPHDVPHDVITMNSSAELVDLDTGEILTLTVVFPADADMEQNKISVLAPIGAAMLGYRLGDEFQWNVPQGIRRIKVIKIHYQPEAAGVFDS